jgi:hypothetical protein
MTKLRFIVFMLMFVGALPVISSAEQWPFSANLWRVNKIQVGEMGQSDEAARFRLLLEDVLSKKGYTVVSAPDQADAVLTGILAVRFYDDDSLARPSVQLKSTSGERLWGGDFQPRSSLKLVRDTVKFRAENIAGDLRKDSNKTAKAAGQAEVK